MSSVRDYVEELLAAGSSHVGYLLKDSFMDGDDLTGRAAP